MTSTPIGKAGADTTDIQHAGKTDQRDVGVEKCTVLLCASVAELFLNARHLALLRSAGSVSFNAVEECVLGEEYVPMAVEVNEPIPNTHAPIQPLGLESRYGVDEDGFDKDDYESEASDVDSIPDELNDNDEEESEVAIAGADGTGEVLTEANQDTVSTRPRNVSGVVVSQAAMRRGIITRNNLGIRKLNPKYIRYIWNCKKRVIGNDFLLGCNRLEVLDLKGFDEVTTVGRNFLFGCSSLLALQVPSSLTRVGRAFLQDCSALSDVDIGRAMHPSPRATSKMTESRKVFGDAADSMFNSHKPHTVAPSRTQLAASTTNPVTTIVAAADNVFEFGVLFMACCASIKSADLSPFANVTVIKQGFMAFCTSMESIDLTPFANVTHILEDFLEGCSALQEIDLKPLKNVTHITAGFLTKCTALKAVDMTPLVKLQSAGEYFMHSCTCLECVTFGDHPHLSCIEAEFLKMCANLKTVQISQLHNLRRVYKDFLCGCAKLENLDLTPLKCRHPYSCGTCGGNIDTCHSSSAGDTAAASASSSSVVSYTSASAMAPNTRRQRWMSGGVLVDPSSSDTRSPSQIESNNETTMPVAQETTTLPSEGNDVGTFKPNGAESVGARVVVSSRGFLRGCTHLRSQDLSDICFSEKRTRRPR